MSQPKPRAKHHHKGVALQRRKLPSGAVSWRRRYTEPDTGEVVWETYEHPTRATEKGTPRAVVLWAEEKASELAKRKLQLEGGAHAVQATDLSDSVEAFFKAGVSAKGPISKRTELTYRLAVDPFVEWMKRHGATRTTDVNRGRLTAWREHISKLPRHASVPGGSRRSHKVATEDMRSPASVNSELRALKTVLNYLRGKGQIRLTGDDLRDCLKPLRVPDERPEYLRQGDIVKLIEAALRHDADTFTAVRSGDGVVTERAKRKLAAGENGKGQHSAIRTRPVAPFVTFVLLSGMRFNEALSLNWSQVDLDALDHDRKKVGEIVLGAASTKTKKERTVGLEVSPALRTILAAMHLASGGKGRVFPLTRMAAEAARKRLIKEYGAPEGFTWQALRRTCGTYLTCAPGIYGGASAFRSAAQLGHSVQVAEKHYLGVLRGIPREARDLDSAMQIVPELANVLASLDRKASPAPAAAPLRLATA